MNKLTIESFLEKSTEIHNGKYDYSLVDYKNNKTDVIINCPIHGQFLQRPNNHLKGCGCPKCIINKGIRHIQKESDSRKGTLFKMTLKEASYIEGSANNKYSRIRSSARAVFKDLLKESCQICGYDKHVELCHIKSISSFEENTLVKEINSKDNLIMLCPNCHWELDHGLLNLL